MNSSFRTLFPRKTIIVPLIIGMLVFAGIQYVRGQETTSRRTTGILGLPNLVNPQLLDKTKDSFSSRRALHVNFSDSVPESPENTLPPSAEMPALVATRNLLKSNAEPLVESPPVSSVPLTTNFSDVLDSPESKLSQIGAPAIPGGQDITANELRNPLPPDLFGRAVTKDPLLVNIHGEPAMNSPLVLEQTTKLWISPNSKWRPLYFEDASVERYGNHSGIAQPFYSGAHFFGSAVFLPYKLATQHPNSCEYGLGHLRPGNCVPGFRESPNVNAKGAVTQGIVAAGMVFAF